jgi:hypothetical protein
MPDTLYYQHGSDFKFHFDKTKVKQSYYFPKVRDWGYILMVVTQDVSKYNNLGHEGQALWIHLRDKFKSNKKEIIPPSLSFEVWL